MRADRSTNAGLLAVGASAAVLSFRALSGLAALAGVDGTWGFTRLAWLFPVAVDAYAATATLVWLRADVSRPTRAWARLNALTAVVSSVIGNAAYHELTPPGTVPPLVVVAVSAVPPLFLGGAVHLAVLVSVPPAPGKRSRRRDNQAGTVSSPAVSVVPVEQSRRLELVPLEIPSGPAAGGNRLGLMRDYWNREREAGRTPTGADLDRVAETKDYGRKIRRQFLAEEQLATGGA